jgi:hypothetical protein
LRRHKGPSRSQQPLRVISAVTCTVGTGAGTRGLVLSRDGRHNRIQNLMKSGASINLTSNGNGTSKRLDGKRATVTELTTLPSPADPCAALRVEGRLRPTRSVSTDIVRAHALGISLDTHPEDDDMERFIRMDKERLIDRHMQEVAALNADIEGWRERASKLGDELRHRKTLIDRLWLTVFGLALVMAYLYLRDIGCK